MRITCPHCTTDYHADFLGLAKRGPQDKHAIACVCGSSFEVTFSQRKLTGKGWRERLRRWNSSEEFETVAHVTPAED